MDTTFTNHPTIDNMVYTQVILLCAAVAVAVASPSGYGGANRDIYHAQDGHGHNFGYNIGDHYTGDVHGRKESGAGGHHVAGSYYLHDPYGYIRTVDYVAGGHGGTHQHVKGSPYGLYVHTPYYSITPTHHHG